MNENNIYDEFKNFMKFQAYVHEKEMYEETLEELEYKKKLLMAKNIHPYPIYHSEKSGWFTNLKDDSSPKGMRKVRKCSEEKLLITLYEYYYDKKSFGKNLKTVFQLWINWKSTPENEENISRIIFSWETYYLNEPLSKEIINKPMLDITTLELREWAESLMRKHAPNKKKFYRMFLIINQCYEYACDEDLNIVPENLWQKARKKLNRQLITKELIPTDESQVFTDEERMWMKEAIYKDMITYKKQYTSAGLQILFLFETGLRIGECCGLKWSDIDMSKKRLYVQRQANNERVKEHTKTNSGFRNIPLTKEAMKILEDVKLYNQKHRFKSEWIFQGRNPKYDGRLSYNSAYHKLVKLCDRMDTERKSPHKCRKTCISTLLDCPDINARTVQRFAGHADITTTLSRYSFERKSLEQQADAIDRALSLD